MSSDRKKTVLSIFGTRPEAIKMAPVVKALERSRNINSKVLVTGQHRKILDQTLKLFNIIPDFDLNIMKKNQDLFDITSNMLTALKEPLNIINPDLVLVHGDTTTCLSAGLASYYHGAAIGHVEAGLRTGNIRAPFPEEANRSILGTLADIHFSPTPKSAQNLLKEGVPKSQIHVTGNTVIDALLAVKNMLHEHNPYNWGTLPKETCEKIESKPEKIILITGHRRENFGRGFIDFCSALKNIANYNTNWLLVYPVHLNPNVQKPVFELLSGNDNIHLIPPQDYLPFVWLMDHCDLVITDSGGIQEEAPSFGKPVLVTRDVTERPEAVDAGTVLLVGTDPKAIYENTIEILESPSLYETMSTAHNPYGDGTSASRILSIIEEYFSK